MGKRKKWRAEDNIASFTKDYEEAAALGVWKVERKFADEIKDAAKSLNVTVKLDRIAWHTRNSFVWSCLLQLRRENIYLYLESDIKLLADKFEIELFRRLVGDFMLRENSPRITNLRKESRTEGKQLELLLGCFGEVRRALIGL